MRIQSLLVRKPAPEKCLAMPGSKASIIGTGMKVPARFAAMANGTFIHADDYDDTQLSVAPDRIYGLLRDEVMRAMIIESQGA